MGCQSWPLHNQIQSFKSVCWYSDALWALFCSEDRQLGAGRRLHVAGEGVNDAGWDRVVTEGPWLNMDRHTHAVSQSQGNATADYPPSPLLSDPNFPARLHTYSFLFNACKHMSLLLYSLLTGCRVYKLSAWDITPDSFSLFQPQKALAAPHSSSWKHSSCVSSGVKCFNG